MIRKICIFFAITFLLIKSVYANFMNVERAFLEQDYNQVKVFVDAKLKDKNSVYDTYNLQRYAVLSYMYLGDYNGALKILKGIIQSKGLTVDQRDRAYACLIDVFYLLQNYDKAEQASEEIRHLSPTSDYTSVFYLKRARIKFKQAKWAEARRLLGKIIDEYPYSPDVYFARQLLKEKQFFSVQVGAFKSYARARSVVSDLKAKGEEAYIVNVEDYKKTKFYRVRVGKVSELSRARQLKDHLVQQGYPTQIYP